MALIDRIHAANRKIDDRQYYRLYFNDKALGFIDTQLLDMLTPPFQIQANNRRVDVHFNEDAANDTTEAIEQLFKDYFTNNQLNPWRGERYAIKDNFTDTPAILIERAILSYLGLTGYGVHVNGYTKKQGHIYMWIAKRSATKPTAPGKLDQIAAGGQPYDQSLFDNLIKECEEEANIPFKLAQHAHSVSAVSYWYDMSIGARPDVIFNYDLYLPPEFQPSVNDDEVESFELMPIEEVLEIVAQSDKFKINSALVVIDFAIRHGIIKPTHPDYITLQKSMNLREESIAYYSQKCQLL